MNAQSFFENFKHLANAPGGVRRLRDLVSYLAITGGLSKHKAGDSEVTTLAKDTLLAKEQYLEAHRIRHSKRMNAELRQTVASIPERWILLPAGDLVDLLNGKAFKESDWKTSGLPIIRIQNLNNPHAPYNYFQGEVSDAHRVSQDDMLLSWSGTPGTSFGAFIWKGSEAILNQHIFKVIIYSNLLDKEYLRVAINACMGALIGSARGGVGLKHVTKGQIEALQIPCPSIEEQKRIVAKVNELLALFDKLEAQQQERERCFPILSRTSHARFAETPTPTNLSCIFDETSAVSPDDLHQTILRLAFRGRLVPQEPSAESGDVILRSIAELKAEKKDVGTSARSMPHVPINENEKPYSLPNSWAWARLGEIAHLKHGFAFKSELFTDKPTPFVLTTPGNFFEDGGFRDRGHKTKYYRGQPPSEFTLAPGDLIIPMTEQAAGLLGSPAFIPDDGKTYLHNQRLGKLDFYSKQIDLGFVFWFFNTAYFRKELADTCTGMKVRHTSPSKVLRVPFPICSLAEQRRIVARVDELMALVNHLEAQQQERDKLAEALAKTCVASFTGTTQLESPEKMKAPKTELVSLVTLGKKPKPDVAAPLAKLLSQNKGTLLSKSLWQQSGLTIDEYYQQLKSEIAIGWIAKPAVAEMKILEEA